MFDKIEEIENKWNHMCETDEGDEGQMFGDLLTIAYDLAAEVSELKTYNEESIKDT